MLPRFGGGFRDGFTDAIVDFAEAGVLDLKLQRHGYEMRGISVE